MWGVEDLRDVFRHFWSDLRKDLFDERRVAGLAERGGGGEDKALVGVMANHHLHAVIELSLQHEA